MSIEAYILRGVYLLGAIGLLMLAIGGLIIFRKAKTSKQRRSGIALITAGVLQSPFLILWTFGLANGTPYLIVFAAIAVVCAIALRRFK